MSEPKRLSRGPKVAAAQAMGSQRPRHSLPYPTIGYLGSSLVVEQPWQAGLIDAARQRSVNLLIFSGSGLESPHLVDAQRSRIFELAGQESLDGLIIGSDFLGHYVGAEKIRDFCQHYRPLPVVKYEPLVEGFPTLLFDFYQGMYDLISHLIEVHSFTKIAYITGPEQSTSIRDRFQAYQAALAAHDILYDETLVVTGSISASLGAEAVRAFLDERRLRPQRDIQALVGFHDGIAVTALNALTERGVAVPAQIAVAGFDDDEIAFAAHPRLTTVRLPFYEIGRWGVDTLAAILEGQTPSAVTTLPASLVIRQSCGCKAESALLNFGLSTNSIADETPPAVRLPQERERILRLLLMTSGIQNVPRFRADIEQMLDLFIAECSDSFTRDLSATFTENLGSILGRMGSIHYNIEMIYAVLTVLEQEFIHLYPQERARLWLHHLFQRARAVAGEIVERFLISEKVQAADLDSLLHEINQEMATTLDEPDLVDVLARHLPRLGIPACYLSLYEDPTEITGGARLILAYTRRGRVPLPTAGRRFPARKLIPGGLRDVEQPTCLVVMPLFHREEQMGFVVFERGPQYGGLYEALREQISSALKRIHLHKTLIEARRRAEEANALKSRFLSTVTHELRAPLSMIVSLSEMLLEDPRDSRTPLPDDFRHDLALIHQTGQHLDRLLLDVLDLGRSQLGQLPIHLKLIDPGELLAEMARVGEQMAREKKLAWRAYIPPSLPLIKGDRTRLRQILLNLLSNAVKFTLQGEVSLLVTVGEREITVAVSDTGLGIPRTDQRTIFDEFYQSERTSARGYGGMGLGLAITRRLVEMHGGKIHLISSGEEGQGTTFYFTLPIEDEALEVDAESEETLDGETVMVISQPGQSVEPLVAHLERQGFVVHRVQIGPDAQWSERALAQPCHAVIINCDASSAWGWEVLRTLQSHPDKRDLPILFYNLHPEADRGAVVDLNLLSKPLNLDAVMKTLAQQGLVNRDGPALSPTILVVDDEPETLRLHTHLIRQHLPHVRLLEAENGRAALDLMLRTPPDLVLLDLMMPEVDGFGVLEAMQSYASLRAIPVIIMTGQVLPEEVMLRLNRCVAGILGKGIFSVDETLKQIVSSLARDRRLGSEAQRIARRTLGYIHTHYANSLSRGDMAAHLGINERYLTHCFRQEVGITPMEYLNRYRVKIAKTLLETETWSITEIGLEVGFSSSAHFSRVFHQHVGVSPREYLRSKG